MFSKRSLVIIVLINLSVQCFNFTAFADAIIPPLLVVDIKSRQVLIEKAATNPWYPASLSKLMSLYVIFDSVKNKKIELSSPIIFSKHSVSMPPTKMDLKVGQKVTLSDAIKMMMVKSANDVTVAIAETLTGSEKNFVTKMNEFSIKLGMAQSHWVTPHGLPNTSQITTAKDLGILTIALYRDFPEFSEYLNLGDLSFNGKVIENYNMLIGRYPGADGLKTGFICSSGFNIIATAKRASRHLAVIVLGAPSSRIESIKAIENLNKGFKISDATMQIEDIPIKKKTTAPDLRKGVCNSSSWSKPFMKTVRNSPEPLINDEGSQVRKNGKIIFLKPSAILKLKRSEVKLSKLKVIIEK